MEKRERSPPHHRRMLCCASVRRASSLANLCPHVPTEPVRRYRGRVQAACSVHATAQRPVQTARSARCRCSCSRLHAMQQRWRTCCAFTDELKLPPRCRPPMSQRETMELRRQWHAPDIMRVHLWWVPLLSAVPPLLRYALPELRAPLWRACERRGQMHSGRCHPRPLHTAAHTAARGQQLPAAAPLRVLWHVPASAAVRRVLQQQLRPAARLPLWTDAFPAQIKRLQPKGPRGSEGGSKQQMRGEPKPIK
jgi:hypothetical protein